MPKYSAFIDAIFGKLPDSSMKSSLTMGRILSPEASSAVARAKWTEIIAPCSLNSGVHVDLLKAAMLIWNDDFDRAHRYAQEVNTPEGAYWHAILHRREPDYVNALYWYDRVGSHPVYHKLARQFPGWKPDRFIAECRGESQPKAVERLVKIQLKEFEWLLEHTFNLCVLRKK